MESLVYVYALRAPGDNEFVYYGSTSNPRARLNQHRSSAHVRKASNSRYREWMLEHNPVEMKILSKWPDRASAVAEESRLTDAAREAGSFILNRASGNAMPKGVESHWFGRKHTPDWKAAASERVSGSKHPMWGRRLSREERASRGRPGVANHNSVFSPEDVWDIRVVSGIGAPIRSIASAYGVNYSTIARLLSGETYRDVR